MQRIKNVSIAFADRRTEDMNRREFLKVTGIVMVSVPLLGQIKQVVWADEITSIERKESQGIRCAFYVKDRFWKIDYIPHHVPSYYFSIWEEPVCRLSTEITSLDMRDTAARFDYLPLVGSLYGPSCYECSDPKVFIDSENRLRRNNEVAV